MRIDVAQVIDDGRLTPRHFAIVAMGLGVMIVDGYDLSAMAIAIPHLSASWGIAPADLSVALSAVFVGVFFGSGGAGWLGDRIGRKRTLILTLMVAALGMFATTFVENTTELALARFVTGAGAGGGIPVILAYTQEHMPSTVRNLFTALMYTGAGIGAVIGGLAGPSLLAAGGWQAIFAAGGFAALFLIALVAIGLSESVRFLVSKGAPPARIEPLLSRLNTRFEATEGAQYVLVETREPNARGVVAELFARELLAITLLVWLVFVSNQFLVFYVVSWLPTLLVGEGVSMAEALYILALFNLGGVVGGALFGLFGDRLAPARVLTATYALAILFLAGFAISGTNILLLAFAGTFAGAAIVGSSFLLGAFTPSLYPTRARSTGIGAALAVGRFGSIAAPLLGGQLLALGYGFDKMMAVAMVPAFVCTAAIFAIHRRTRSTTSHGADEAGA